MHEKIENIGYWKIQIVESVKKYTDRMAKLSFFCGGRKELDGACSASQFTLWKLTENAKKKKKKKYFDLSVTNAN